MRRRASGNLVSRNARTCGAARYAAGRRTAHARRAGQPHHHEGALERLHVLLPAEEASAASFTTPLLLLRCAGRFHTAGAGEGRALGTTRPGQRGKETVHASPPHLPFQKIALELLLSGKKGFSYGPSSVAEAQAAPVQASCISHPPHRCCFGAQNPLPHYIPQSCDPLQRATVPARQLPPHPPPPRSPRRRRGRPAGSSRGRPPPPPPWDGMRC